MRRILLWAFLALALLVTGSMPSAQAAKPHGGEPHKEQERKEEGGYVRKMADQAIWTLVVFGLLLFILYKYAWPQMLEGLHKREESIRQAAEDARLAREETARLREELHAEQARANEEARQIRDEARQAAERIAAQEMARGKAEIQAERERLLRELETARDQALHEIRSSAVELATRLSAKVVRKHLSEAEHRQLLDEAVAEFRAAAVGRRREVESMNA
jgi:F-type H+-transporting ATPase subunit b